ncbi:hypothetical protein L6164_031576 [Bauhinia variegata]|uniref:Uncharacterized protein n=1 Tax=Bauhinia variegata TaxID=167791 RepID=A0ACB9LGA9_BAUVA|nr:hypothetical protein L6164_031576 [Bauhinia variegata]
MTPVTQLPCDSDGVCMVCMQKPPTDDTLFCKTCVTPWHIACLLARDGAIKTQSDGMHWECPDCSPVKDSGPAQVAGRGESTELIAAIRAIESDTSLTDQEKARRRQQLLGGSASANLSDHGEGSSNPGRNSGFLDILDDGLNCSFCRQLPERPVTTPCGHNFCLKCFQKWIGQGHKSCAKCRCGIPSGMASDPKINSQLAMAIRVAKRSRSNGGGAAVQPRPYNYLNNDDRPDEAFTTERAKKAGKANASSGRILVTTHHEHFGPILAEHDPTRNRGILVGDTWFHRLDCRQWGVHRPHVAGIAGQSGYGAQSVAISGGYVDDEDHGDWFLYTGSGGKDLSGNRRNRKEHSFDQEFESSNEALRVSCRKGYPVRVIRSSKEKSPYAPASGLRYDGIYRIEKCWRIAGKQGQKVCRYLFVRCDNEPAPWTSDDHGDQPRPLPVIEELERAIDFTERKGSPSWDYDDEKGCWLWKKPPPLPPPPKSTKHNEDGTQVKIGKRKGKRLSPNEQLLKKFRCSLCWKVLTLPVTTSCAHNFCKACLEERFAGQSYIRSRTCQGGRSLRAQKNVMKCPTCSIDITEFLQNLQVNRELMGIIESLQHEAEEIDQNAEESNEKTEEKNLCDAGDSVLEELNDNDLNLRTSKRLKIDGEFEFCQMNTEPDIFYELDDNIDNSN